MTIRIRKGKGVVAAAGLLASLVVALPASAAPGKVLILGPTVSGGTGSIEARLAGTGSVFDAPTSSTLTGLGFGVDVVDAATWSGMTTAQFASYKAIILGDATCTTISAAAAAVANNSVWGAAVTGNVLIDGTDPVFHGKPREQYNAIKFATDKDTTGAYISLSCYYHAFPLQTAVPLLDPFGTFKVRGVGCYNDSHIVAVHPALAGLTDAYLSNWSCSVHEAFDTFPTASFIPLAIANGVVDEGALPFADGTSGVPYILARGAVPVKCGDGVLQSPEECDTGAANGTCGSACSAICKKSFCGNGVVDAGEECDLGCSGGPGTACSSECKTLSTTHAAPSCALTAVLAGPPKELEITIQDSDTGVASIEVTDSTNATVVVPAFASGETGTLLVKATKLDESVGAHVALRVTDVDGTITDCDPVIGGESAEAESSSSGPNAGGCSIGHAGQTSGLLSLFGLAALAGLAVSRRRKNA